MVFIDYIDVLCPNDMIMSFHNKNIFSIIISIQNNSRPFDEILFSLDSTTNSPLLNTDNDYCPYSNTTFDNRLT